MKGKKQKYPELNFSEGKRYLLILTLLLIGLLARSQDTTLVTIANVSGAPSEMKMQELRSVFLGERQKWKDGTKVIIAMVKSTAPLGKLVSERIYQMTPDNVRAFWATIVFAGKFDSPYVFNSASEVESFVAANPGAIAIVHEPVSRVSVKTVKIDGKKTF